MKRLSWLAALAVLVAGGMFAACSSSPSNIAGDYTVAVTNGSNGCNFPNYTVGNQNTGVAVTITQTGSNATAVVSGLSALALDAVLGSDSFTGTVDGDAADLTVQGTKSMTTGNCTYTYNGEIAATLDTNSLNGTLTYTGATNNSSDCGTIQGCVTTQDFAGSRPPP
jgi:hypothetical protein